MNNEPSLIPLLTRAWPVLFVGIVLGCMVGFVADRVVPKQHEATADLLVGPVNATDNLDASGTLSATYENLATSRAVLADALRDTNRVMSIEDLAKKVRATSNTVTRIVSIRVKDETADGASDLANAIGDQLAKVTNTVPPRAESQFDAFDQQPEVQSLNDNDRRRVGRAVRRTFGPSTAGELTVINEAVPSNSPANPTLPVLILLGGVGGFVVAMLIVLIRPAPVPPKPDAAAA